MINLIDTALVYARVVVSVLTRSTLKATSQPAARKLFDKNLSCRCSFTFEDKLQELTGIP